MSGPEKRWSWWSQTRDAVALIAGLVLLGTESFRGTYNPIAMLFAAVCLGIVGSSALTRYFIGRWDEKDKEA